MSVFVCALFDSCYTKPYLRVRVMKVMRMRVRMKGLIREFA